MKLILVAFLFLIPAHAYKFLCNGITAEGEVESDSCPQKCTNETATRWLNKTIRYNIHTSILAEGVSASDWKSVVIESFDAWAQTPGGGLMATYVGEGVRSFGTDSQNQDIFFVTSETEWMDRVGAAADGILGVTLPPYYCPNSQVSYRVIDDADMILNGVPSSGFKWAKTCSKLSDNCQSMFATVAHESGHALGLGHPCTDCALLMSAQAAYLIEHPLFDDQEGLRALYPGTSSGLLGAACPCAAGLTCHTQGTNEYCSTTPCTNTCSNSSMVCTNNFCEFPNAASALHEECSQKPCDSGLACVGVDESSSYCFTDCTDSQTCQDALETCHQLKSNGQKINTYACMKMVKQGESCGQTIVCQTGLKCSSGVCEVSTGGSSGSSCSSVKTPTEIWLLLALLGILVHRSQKKC